MATGTCKHGEFELMEGCPTCIAERRQAGIRPEQDEMEEGLNSEGLTLANSLVKVQYYKGEEPVGRDYTYFSEDDLAVGDIVIVPVRDTTGKAVVVEINVPEKDVEAFRDKVKTIPAGSVVLVGKEAMYCKGQESIDIDELPTGGLAEAAQKAGAKVTVAEATFVMADTKINLCDTCTERNDYPICCPPDVTFGNGKGNDNIIQCSKYILGTAKPCTIPLNVLITPETAVALRPGEDIEARNHYEEALRLLEYAERRVITSLEDNKAASDDLTIISRLKKTMEAKKREYLDPLRDQAEAIRETYSTLMDPILAAEKLTKDKMLVYGAQQRRIRDAQEEINRKRLEAAQEEMELKGELSESVNLVEVIPDAPKTIKTFMGTSGTKENWKWEVIDFALVPDEYKMINPAILTPAAKSYKNTRTIPGIRIYNDPIIATRAR